METKTNVMRILDAAKIEYHAYRYPVDRVPGGVEVAGLLGLPCERVFKTLVTVGKSNRHYVFMIPVAAELNLKKAALASGEKDVVMLKAKELLPLTGYVHGGCSPIGMKKPLPTFIDDTALLLDELVFSAGRIGFQVAMPLLALQTLVPVQPVSLT